MLPETFLTRLVSGSMVRTIVPRICGFQGGEKSAPAGYRRQQCTKHRCQALVGAGRSNKTTGSLANDLLSLAACLAACCLASKHLGTTGTAAQPLRSTLLLPRADPPRLLEIGFSLPRVSDSIDSAAAVAAACVVR